MSWPSVVCTVPSAEIVFGEIRFIEIFKFYSAFFAAINCVEQYQYRGRNLFFILM